MHMFVAAVAMGSGLVVTPAFAGAADIVTANTVTDCQPHDAAQEAADSALIATVVPLMQVHDLTALTALRPTVEAALSHAPDRPSLPEVCGNTIVIYSSDTETFLARRARLGSDPRFAGAVFQMRQALPYATLGYISGWIAYEQGDTDAAITAYRKGLANDPASADLALEYSNALAHGDKAADVVAFLDDFLAANPDLDPLVTARLQRRRGYALADLQRFDDALAACEVSLRLDPANPATAAEIVEINRKKALRN